MQVKMTEELQSLIIAVQSFRKWVYADSVVRGIDLLNNSSLEKAYDYFKELKPERLGLNTTVPCFMAVMKYPIEDTVHTQMNELPDKFSFGW